MQILIFHNPNSGKRKSQKYADRLEREIKKRAPDTTVTQFAAISIQILNEFWASPLAKQNFDAVIIIGGDGTVGPVINAMKHNKIDVPIYCFGRGTANDFSGFLKTNCAPKRAVKAVLSGKYSLVDTLFVNGTNYACNNAAGGACTTGVTKYNKKLKMFLGKPAYIVTAFFKAFTLKSQLLRFTVDGKVFEADVFLFYILNTKNVGGVKNASPLSDIHDGKLDLVCIKRTGFFGKITMAIAKIFGLFHKSRHVIHMQGTNFTVEIVPDRPIMPNFTRTDIDGNPFSPYPLHVQIGEKIKVLQK